LLVPGNPAAETEGAFARRWEASAVRCDAEPVVVSMQEVTTAAMPELPEVETMRRGVSAVKGCRIDDVQRIRCQLRPVTISPATTAFRRRAVGCTIADVTRAGKRVVLQLSSDDAIVLEPRMTGLVLVSDPPNLEHLRFRIQLSGGGPGELLYWDRRGLGSVRLLSPRRYHQELGPHKLGPDALEVTAAQLRDRFRQSRREIKVALLDQRSLAGIGNLYASEILHVAGIAPWARCDQLSKKQWQHIHVAMREVLQTAIRYEGSTLADGTYRTALNHRGSYQNHHRVYNRAGEDCGRCRRGVIQRAVQNQRSTFYCPVCQS
jgi:formamidopyrimidine-DNA glycosylase